LIYRVGKESKKRKRGGTQSVKKKRRGPARKSPLSAEFFTNGKACGKACGIGALSERLGEEEETKGETA